MCGPSSSSLLLSRGIGFSTVEATGRKNIASTQGLREQRVQLSRQYCRIRNESRLNERSGVRGVMGGERGKNRWSSRYHSAIDRLAVHGEICL